MSVTLFDSGLVLSDTQGTRLDAFCVAIWLPRYVAENGSEPTGWPAASAHEILAEWAIVETMKQVVLRWERLQAEAAVSVDPW